MVDYKFCENEREVCRVIEDVGLTKIAAVCMDNTGGYTIFYKEEKENTHECDL